MKTLLRTVVLDLPTRAVFFAARAYGSLLRRLRPTWGERWKDLVIGNIWSETLTVRHRDVELKFVSPSALASWRATTFSSKEPETIQWMDEMGGTNVPLLDIGANVGLYSLYYSKKFGASVFSIEPSVFNLEALARNVNLNGLERLVHVLPFPLAAETGIADFQLSNTDYGGALSAFSVDYGADGKQLRRVFSYRTAGFSIDTLYENRLIPAPGLIKIDVDGIEDLVLRGATKLLRHPQVRSVLVEVCQSVPGQDRRIADLLQGVGFVRSLSSGSNQSFNEIWVKPSPAASPA